MKHHFFTLLISATAACGMAQNNPILSMDIKLRAEHSDSAVVQGTDTLHHLITQHRMLLTALVPDDSQITQVQVKVGTQSGTDNLHSGTYDWQQTGTLQDGTHWQRNAMVNLITLGLSRYYGTHYAAFRVKKNNVWSDYALFETQPD